MDRDTGEAGEVHTSYDRERDGSLTAAIVEAVAALNGGHPTDMEPLGTAIDPGALEQLVFSLGRSSREGRVGFTFDGCRVTVTSDGAVTVRLEPATPDQVTTEAEFEAALARLVREAEANGVGVDGGWACQGGSLPTWGIEIYEVEE